MTEEHGRRPNTDAFMRAIGKIYAYKMVGGWLSTIPVAQVAENIKAEIEALEEEWGLTKKRETKDSEPDRASNRTPRPTRTASSRKSAR